MRVPLPVEFQTYPLKNEIKVSNGEKSDERIWGNMPMRSKLKTARLSSMISPGFSEICQWVSLSPINVVKMRIAARKRPPRPANNHIKVGVDTGARSSNCAIRDGKEAKTGSPMSEKSETSMAPAAMVSLEQTLEIFIFCIGELFHHHC